MEGTEFVCGVHASKTEDGLFSSGVMGYLCILGMRMNEREAEWRVNDLFGLEGRGVLETWKLKLTHLVISRTLSL